MRSAGNHAQGVASATKIGVDNIIVMSTDTPSIKVDACRKWGGTVCFMAPTMTRLRVRRCALRQGVLSSPIRRPVGHRGTGHHRNGNFASNVRQRARCYLLLRWRRRVTSGSLAYVKVVRPQVKIYGLSEDAAGMTESVEVGVGGAVMLVCSRMARLCGR